MNWCSNVDEEVRCSGVARLWTWWELEPPNTSAVGDQTFMSRFRSFLSTGANTSKLKYNHWKKSGRTGQIKVAEIFKTFYSPFHTLVKGWCVSPAYQWLAEYWKIKMVIVRQKESNLLEYNVAGDCLATKLESDLKSWTKYLEQIQLWSEI